MRERIWLAGLFLSGVLLVTLGATSVFADEPAAPNGEAEGEMLQACENGDYEAMAKLHDQYCGDSDGMMGNGMMGNDTRGNGMMGGGARGGGMMGNW